MIKPPLGSISLALAYAMPGRVRAAAKAVVARRFVRIADIIGVIILTCVKPNVCET